MANRLKYDGYKRDLETPLPTLKGGETDRSVEAATGIQGLISQISWDLQNTIYPLKTGGANLMDSLYSYQDLKAACQYHDPRTNPCDIEKYFRNPKKIKAYVDGGGKLSDLFFHRERFQEVSRYSNQQNRFFQDFYASSQGLPVNLIKAVQAWNGLTVDGIWGPNTWKKLGYPKPKGKSTAAKVVEKLTGSPSPSNLPTKFYQQKWFKLGVGVGGIALILAIIAAVRKRK